ncbi:MAG: hypothetical protein ACJ8F7_18310 [Gemmataceae bacterium]
MSPLFTTDDADRIPEPPPAPATCPQCGGPLFELRGLSRCARCYFVVCQGCESDRPRAVEEGSADW